MRLTEYCQTILDAVGNTPLIKLTKLSEKYGCIAPIYAKAEFLNPSGTVKIRAAKAMVERFVEGGELKAGGTVIEPTGGSGGIAISLVCAIMGFRAVIVMPDSVSERHRALISAYGGEVVLTPSSHGSDGAEQKALAMCGASENAVILRQFDNEENPKAHRTTTAREILSLLPQVDYFIAGVGTGGTITGCGEAIKMYCPECKVIAVEPIDSPVLSGGFSGAHALSGIGSGFVPEVLNTYILDEVVRVRTPDSLTLMRELASLEGLLCGVSSGAALVAAISVAKRAEARGKVIVTVLPDSGERYLDKF